MTAWDRALARRTITPTGCWEFGGYCNDHGYGRIKGDDSKLILVHRLSWMVNRGPIPPGVKVLHQCDNPPCFNPDCLFLGTQLDNMADMRAKGRERKAQGEKVGTAKLTRPKVEDIRRLRAANGRSYGSLAAQFGVTTRAIVLICRGETWR